MRSWAAAGLDGGRFLGSCPVDPFGPLGAILASKESDQRWNRCLEYVCTDLKYSERCPLRSGGNRKRLFGVQGRR